MEALSYIRFIEGPPKPKTRTWFVLPADNDNALGRVIWFGRWRCYSFFPYTGAVFERRCLRDIADFCERKTAEHRSGAER